MNVNRFMLNLTHHIVLYSFSMERHILNIRFRLDEFLRIVTKLQLTPGFYYLHDDYVNVDSYNNKYIHVMYIERDRIVHLYYNTMKSILYLASLQKIEATKNYAKI